MKALPIGLAVLSAALCVVIAGELSSHPPDAGPVARSATGGVSPQPPQPLEPPNRRSVWLDQILARPLFSPDRRPVEVGGVSGLPRLTGIVVAGSQRVAIFAGPANQHPIVAEAGTRVGAFEVQTIGDSGVTVVGPEGTSLLRPIFDPVKPSALPMAPPSQPNRAQTTRPATR